jgi:serine protease Do
MKTKLYAYLALILFIFASPLIVDANPLTSPAEEETLKEVTKKVYPSVVRIHVKNKIKKVATGVVIDKDGSIVTTALISPRDADIFITTADGKESKAEFLGLDVMTHLAVVKAKDVKLPHLTLGKIKELGPGEWIGVVSISSESTPSVTQGVVSSVGKEIIRLNVWVVPGMSGSPVVDKEGRMVGLLRGVYSDEKPVVLEFKDKEVAGSGILLSRAEAPSSGMALAVPIHIVQMVASEIKEKGKVQRGWLGVSIIDNKDKKVEIIGVEKDSPAELANLKKGDIILKVEGKDMTNTGVLVKAIQARKPGQETTITIERKEKTEDVKVKLGELAQKEILEEFEMKFPKLFPKPPKAPKPPKIDVPEPPEPPEHLEKKFWTMENRKFIGVYIEELTRELAEHFGVEEGTGILITKFSEISPAKEAGMQVGDVIIKADGERVESSAGLIELIQEKENDETIKITVIRDKKEKTLKVKVAEEEKKKFEFYSQEDWEKFQQSMEQYAKKLDEYYKNWEGEYSEELKLKMKKLTEQMKKYVQIIEEEAKEGVKKIKVEVKKESDTIV